MSGNSKEIPGFYRDPVTGKYYRDVPGSSNIPALKKLKIEREVNEEYKIKPEITNTVRYLNAREIRTTGGMQDTKEYLKMRWHLKEQIKSTALDELRVNFSFTSVDYIIGSKDSVYGFWNDEKYRRYIIGTMEFEDHSHHNLYFHKAFGYVIDMCEGLDDDFIVVYNSSCRNGLLVERVDEYDRMPMLQYGQHFAGRTLEYFKRQVFCCCCNKNSLRYAFGCENVVGFINAHNRESYKKIDGRVHTLAFNDTGNLMASGVHTGKLSLHDLRTKEMVMNMEISKTCLVDSSVLNSHHIIVSGADDVLCCVRFSFNFSVCNFIIEIEFCNLNYVLQIFPLS